MFVPRPETEVLVARAVEALDGINAPVVADVGTGTGAVALAIKRRRPDASVYATDVSEEAVAVARANASRHSLDVTVLQGDLLSPLQDAVRDRVDLVVSNPPYVTVEEYESLPREVRAEPFEALIGGTDVHRRLSAEAPDWLGPGGWLVMEIGAAQADEVREVMSGRFDHVEVLPDLAGRDRVARGQLPRTSR